jgi:hypothetical protein
VAIFKATAKRNDGGSSFGALVSYIGRGDEREGHEPTAPLIDSELFEGMPPHLYGELRSLSDAQTLGDIEHAQERPAKAAEKTLGGMKSLSIGKRDREPPEARVPMETNCLDLATAAEEMEAVAAMNPRVKDPVYHFLVSLKSGERLPNETMFDIARYTMKELGFEGHQYVAAIHDDTNNLHVHVALNRVRVELVQDKEDPEKEKEVYIPIYPKKDHYKGAKAMREIELRYGLGHDKGAYAVIERDGEKVVDWASKQQNTNEKAPSKARDMEVHGRESLFSYARAEPRKAVAELLKSNAPTWAELHQVMGRYGLELRTKGQGFAVYDKANQEQTPIKASDMHEAMSKARLEKALGPFEPAPQIDQQAEQTYNPERAPKRDPAKRAQRAEERADQRRQLRELYDEGKKPVVQETAKQVQALKESIAQRAKDITTSAQAERKAIYAADKAPAIKKAMLSVLAAETAKQRAELRASAKRERAAIPKVQPFREWVADQAEAGHPAAISQVRGYLYADKRKLQKWKQADELRATMPGIKGPGPVDMEQDGQLWGIASMTYQVNRQTGDVRYQIAGREAFTDYGKRLTFDGQASTNEAAILAGLQVAQAKFGQALELTGTDEFKRRVAEVAAKQGLRVTFTDPAIEQYRQQLTRPQPQPERAATAEDVARSKREADQLARQHIGQVGKIQVLTEGATARGEIVGETAQHLVQRVSPTLAVTHEKARFAHLPAGQRPKPGQHLAISYADSKGKAVPIQPPARGKGLTR